MKKSFSKARTKAAQLDEMTMIAVVSENDANSVVIHLPRSFINKRVWIITQECYEELKNRRT
jgi:hypothetical protein